MSGTKALSFGKNIWVIDGRRVRWLGLPFERRMTMVKLTDGSLWLHSPVDPLPELFQAAEELGPVRYIVAPNKLHDLFVDEWLDHFPEAQFLSCPGFAHANPKVRHKAQELNDDTPVAWGGEIEHRLFAGNPILNEVLFFHHESRSLIVTDIIQNHDPHRVGFFFRIVARLGGVLAPRGGNPRDWRLTVRDRAAAQDVVQHILAWEFDRLILCHGLCVTTHARAFVERAFEWLHS
ncbi:MAG: DUF4336 domain-containing protein [Chthoniobacterales bacterium]